MLIVIYSIIRMFWVLSVSERVSGGSELPLGLSKWVVCVFWWTGDLFRVCFCYCLPVTAGMDSSAAFDPDKE